MSPTPPFLFSLAGLRAIFNRWKNMLALAAGLAFIVSLGVVLALPDIYSSMAVFLPTSLQNTDPNRLLEGAKLELSARPEDLDRVLSIGQSLPVAELMVRKFDLYRHYDIDEPGTDIAANKVLKEFTTNLSIIHNERDAIELTFQDRDKVLAARVANAMVSAIDSINQQLTLENRRNILTLFSQRSASLNRTYEQNRLALIRARRRYGVFGIPEQGRYLAKAVIATEKELHVAEGGGSGNAAGLRRALRGLTSAEGGNVINLESWTRGNDSITLAAQRLEDLQRRFVEAQGAYDQAKALIGSRVSSLYLLQKAQPATQKSKPLRALIVFSSVLLTLILSVVFILLLEGFRQTSLSEGVGK
jgi:uncharacterized protein involved in exopolysaccharide biosynthesis